MFLSQDRIDGITIQARQFQEAGHFDADNIRKKQEALVVRYEALREPMAMRKQKLSDSLRLQQLFRDVEDEETWIREKEPIAASTNRGEPDPSQQGCSSLKLTLGLLQPGHTLAPAQIFSLLAVFEGKDLIGVQNLLKKHQALQAEIVGHEPRIKAVTQKGETMVEEGIPCFSCHLSSPQLWMGVRLLLATISPAVSLPLDFLSCTVSTGSFPSVTMNSPDPMIESLSTLLLFLLFPFPLVFVTRITKKSNCSSSDCWSCLSAHTPGASALPQICRNLSPSVLSGHFAGEDVKVKLTELHGRWDTLKLKASQRKQDLEDSLQAQQYFADANEAESWMREKEPIVGSTDYGKDEDSAEVNATVFDSLCGLFGCFSQPRLVC